MSQRENAKVQGRESERQGELKAEKRLAKARIRIRARSAGEGQAREVGLVELIKQLMGSASKSDRSKKTHEEKLKRQKKARAQAGETASYIATTPSTRTA